MARAVAFCCDVIGCRVRERLPQYGMVELEAGVALIGLMGVDASHGAQATPAAPAVRPRFSASGYLSC